MKKADLDLKLPDLTDDDQALLSRLLKVLYDRMPSNLMRQARYEGKHVIRQVGKSVIPPQYYRLGLVLGWPAKAVDILQLRCPLNGITWADGDVDELGWAELSENNALGIEIPSALTSSLIHATSFIYNTRGQEGEPTALMHVADATMAAGIWNARRRQLEAFLVVHKYNQEGFIVDLTLFLYGMTIVAKRDTDGRWSTDPQSHDHGMPADPLPFKPRPPVKPFGVSRISRTVCSMTDSALRTVIRLEGHMDVYAYPEFWMLGADESIFRDQAGNIKPQWQVMLGRIKGIPDDEDAENPRADVKQFLGSDPTPQISALKQQAQLFSGETSIPLTSLGVSDMSNPTSADSYIASREDLIAEAEGATDGWSPFLRRRILTGLAMQNALTEIPEEWRSIELQWRSPVHLSRAAEADAGAKIIGAVPDLAQTAVGLRMLGLSPQDIREVQAERRRNNGRTVLQQLVAAQQRELPPIAGQTEEAPVEDEVP